ncbi:Betaine aldehyde dehydrogenase [Nocardiopsis dassonvillei]|jgi:betaine-aldehyde dehydrogenase|uniref:Aldehyde Dehydrogenase n=1 Tax=Nocardiopsis dassonvillei (strain ATCC 23218 / DSM 43111 / CIP 107115 / JCM 7437 / KCTC 9190 / NBRC 14626 / NCTC 10488 / NRRL B-5397 / IMRU 509) TaxID=446468 RepID=D7B9C6_NOCDD|nr:Aldehyde Dehydrogenase [Nocardiopsis dassonvillei subsp. dassonvillei DSM 43111]VEI90994.1 Betaine aldehyde dehydrogenase [Nocardiopsis dassonvillei]
MAEESDETRLFVTNDPGQTGPVNELYVTLPSVPYLAEPGSATATSLYIDGRWRAAGNGRVREILNPADASVLTIVSEGGRADSEEAIAAARRAFDGGEWPRTPAGERGRVLDRIADLLQRDREEIAVMESLDTGKTIEEGGIDVDDVTGVFRYYAGLADKDTGRLVSAPEGVHSKVVYEPVGVCGMITPWNYPLLQLAWKMAPALAAGNTMVVKPSEITPVTTAKLVELTTEAGVPAGVVNLVTGSGPDAGAPLSEHPDVDLISFTGGLATGRRIMAAASETVKKIALELGGKNPNIIFPDVDLDTAVDYALSAAFFHSGQVCSAGARLIVHNDVHDAFTTELARRAEAIRIGRGQDEGVRCGPLVSAEHRAKVEAAVARGVEEGARIIAGGRRPDDPDLAQGYFYRPTVFVDCDRAMDIVQTEVFGPVVTVERFETEQQAVELGNDTDYGLSGGVWTDDTARGERVAAALRHGTVWINDYGPYFPGAEWGGYGRSGIGRELGLAGLDEYREAKHVYRNLSPEPQRWFG